MITPSYEEQATSYELWQEYVDPDGLTTRTEFDDLTVEAKLAMIVEAFGPESAIRE